jgi:hypothetical protein
MTITTDMELPIQPLKIDGPAVRGMQERKEENDHHRTEVADVVAAYEPIKAETIRSLGKIAAITF